MEWGRTESGNRRHVLAEDVPGAHQGGVALCGVALAHTFLDEANMAYWPVCINCETLLQAMESV